MILEKIKTETKIHITAKNISTCVDNVLYQLSKTTFNLVTIIDSDKESAEVYVYDEENLYSTIIIEKGTFDTNEDKITNKNFNN